MRRISVARTRALLGCALFATVTGAASCATTGSTVTVSGKTLTVVISAPANLAGDPQAQDTINAERLAYDQLHGQVTSYTVKLREASHDKISDNARAAIEDSKAIAYVGEFQPGTSADSIGITNAEDLLEVSPTDTAVELTQSTPADPGSPRRYYEAPGTYGRTFARVVPTDRLEAKAIASELGTLGVTKLYLASDRTTYGKALRLALANAASPSISVVSSAGAAQAVLYAGSSAGPAATVLNQAASQNAGLKLFVPSALAQDSLVSVLSPAAQRRLYVSSPGFTASDLPVQGKQFLASFRAAYGHAPAPQAIFGYEAMAAVLAVLRSAGPGANNRSTVVSDFLKLRRSSSDSVLGEYSINASGDTSIAPFTFSRVKSGGLVPFKAVSAQG
jgi:ABC-type branched-subunit amino acid transport system substrate-binding protein